MTELRSLLYVSSSRLSEDEAPAEVAAIVELSRHRNARLAVTGALLFTGSLFAQLLEGPPSAVDALMASIERDPRH